MLPTEPGLVGRAGKQHWGVSWAAGPPDLPEVPIYACQRIKIVNPHCSRNTAVVRSGLAGEQPRLALLLNSETWKSLGSDTGQVCERLLPHGMSGSIEIRNVTLLRGCYVEKGAICSVRLLGKPG